MIVNKFLSKYFKYRVITPDCPAGKVGEPLMTRYALFRRKALAVFLHNFHRSDLDEFHDHPWAFITFLISSGYWEHMPSHLIGKKKGWEVVKPGEVRFWRKRFSILYRPATSQHYIEVVKPTWTLVLRFREVREWGFIIRGVWTPWRRAEELQSRSICSDVMEGEIPIWQTKKISQQM